MRATSTEAEMAREDCALAKRSIESGNYFFPTSMGVYIRGQSLEDLYDKETKTETILSSNGFLHLNAEHDLQRFPKILHPFRHCERVRERGNPVLKWFNIFGKRCNSHRFLPTLSTHELFF